MKLKEIDVLQAYKSLIVWTTMIQIFEFGDGNDITKAINVEFQVCFKESRMDLRFLDIDYGRSNKHWNEATMKLKKQ